ncbi:unnamed protein product [Discosporangium mesarthrocarpum]
MDSYVHQIWSDSRQTTIYTEHQEHGNSLATPFEGGGYQDIGRGHVDVGKVTHSVEKTLAKETAIGAKDNEDLANTHQPKDFAARPSRFVRDKANRERERERGRQRRANMTAEAKEKERLRSRAKRAAMTAEARERERERGRRRRANMTEEQRQKERERGKSRRAVQDSDTRARERERSRKKRLQMTDEQRERERERLKRKKTEQVQGMDSEAVASALVSFPIPRPRESAHVSSSGPVGPSPPSMLLHSVSDTALQKDTEVIYNGSQALAQPSIPLVSSASAVTLSIHLGEKPIGGTSQGEGIHL